MRGPRTSVSMAGRRLQRYEGRSDRTVVAEAARRFPEGLPQAATSTPGIGNTWAGCAAVMLARGALANLAVPESLRALGTIPGELIDPSPGEGRELSCGEQAGGLCGERHGRGRCSGSGESPGDAQGGRAAPPRGTPPGPERAAGRSSGSEWLWIEFGRRSFSFIHPHLASHSAILRRISRPYCCVQLS